jgi:hypothetical protein
MRATFAPVVFAMALVAGCSSPQQETPAPAPPQAAPSTPAPPPQAPPPVAEKPIARPEPPLPRLPDPLRLPPIPDLGFAPPRPIEDVRAVYRFSAMHPEVMRYVPCFCGCERNGHQDNEDCFVQSRAADGSVTWEPHGVG